MIFACTGFPRLINLIRVVVGPVGLRYDRALIYPYDDAWDTLLELSLARIDAIRARDAERVRRTVAITEGSCSRSVGRACQTPRYRGFSDPPEPALVNARVASRRR